MTINRSPMLFTSHYIVAVRVDLLFRDGHIIIYYDCHLQAMSAVVCCGRCFDPSALAEDGSLYPWLREMLSSPNDKVKVHLLLFYHHLKHGGLMLTGKINVQVFAFRYMSWLARLLFCSLTATPTSVQCWTGPWTLASPAPHASPTGALWHSLLYSVHGKSNFSGTECWYLMCF